jgi:hypothetical protein
MQALNRYCCVGVNVGSGQGCDRYINVTTTTLDGKQHGHNVTPTTLDGKHQGHACRTVAET